MNRAWLCVAWTSFVTGAECGAIQPVEKRQWVITMSSSKLRPIPASVTANTKLRPFGVVSIYRALWDITIHNLDERA
jgi:hypothetical protein